MRRLLQLENQQLKEQLKHATQRNILQIDTGEQYAKCESHYGLAHLLDMNSALSWQAPENKRYDTNLCRFGGSSLQFVST